MGSTLVIGLEELSYIKVYEFYTKGFEKESQLSVKESFLLGNYTVRIQCSSNKPLISFTNTLPHLV